MSWFNVKPQRISVEQQMQDELYEAELALLKAHTRVEYAVADLAAQQNRVKRLQNSLKGLTNATEQQTA